MTDHIERLFDGLECAPGTFGEGWSPGLVSLYLISDILLWLACLALPALLFYALRNNRRKPLSQMFWWIGAFIVAMGLVPLLEALTIAVPAYQFVGLARVVVVLISWTTIFILAPLIARALRLPGSGQLEIAIQQRRLAEQELRTSGAAWARTEAEYRSIFEHATEGIFQTTSDGRYRRANPALASIYGYASPEELQACLTDIAGQLYVDAGRREQFIAQMARTGTVAEFESRIRRKDGSVIWISENARAVRDEAGQFLYYEGTVTDITARKNAEQGQHESEKRLRTVVGNAPVIVFALDLEGRLTLAEGKGLETLGIGSKEIIGCSIVEMFKNSPLVLNHFQRALGGESFTAIVELGPLAFETHYAPIREAAGPISGVIGVATDETEKKKLEKQFLRSQRMESIGRLAGGIAHDLNNVLTPITLAAQMLRMRFPDTQSRASLDLMETSALRGANMVRQILSFARGAEGDRAPVLIKNLIEEIDGLLQRTLPKAVEIRTEIPNNLWLVSGDATQLHQVLMNLAVNARDAMPEGGRLTITAANAYLDEAYARAHLEARPGSYIQITLADTGLGMPPEVQERIFDPFFTTKGIGQGTGLGLSTVAGIVKGHGGFINVYSEVGRGTQFSVFLPAENAPSAAEVPQPEKAAPTGEGALVLVVDDEDAIRQITKETLEAFGYRVLTAGDGAEAIQVYTSQERAVNLVLTDWMMPGMDGPATVRELRRLNPQVRVVAASGLMSNAKGEMPGVRAFLAKPYQTEQLLRTVKEALTAV